MQSESRTSTQGAEEKTEKGKRKEEIGAFFNTQMIVNAEDQHARGRRLLRFL